MGFNKRILTAIDRELKDRHRSKKYSKSLSATNSLFAPNDFFRKPSTRRIYNPNAKYFEHGGVHGNVNPIEGDLYSKVLMNRNRGVGFVDRAFALGENPGTPLFNLPDDEQFGSNMSHKMAYGSDDTGQTWMYPTVLNEADEAIKVPNQYADYISRDGYKNATGMIRKNGGNVSWDFKGKSYSGTLIPSMETENNRYARTHNGKIKTLPKRNHGGPHDPPQESAEGQRDWMMNYIQSPMYLKRLSKEFPDYSNEQLEAEKNARLSNVKNINIKYPDKPLQDYFGNVSGEYFPKKQKPDSFDRNIGTGKLTKSNHPSNKKGNLYLEPEYRQDNWNPDEGFNTIPLHELGHAADDGGYRIPYKTEKLIYDSTNKAYEGLGAKYDVPVESYAQSVVSDMPFYYKNNPTEFVNRLIPLRYELERAGIWKPGEEDFIDGMYNLMLKNPDVMKNEYVQDVLDQIPGADDSRSKRAIVTKLLNEIALNDVEQDLNVAKHGGPHDPPSYEDATQAYKDSMAAKEAYEKQYGLDLKKYTDDSQQAKDIYDKYNRNQAYINYIQGFYPNFNPENNYKKYSTFPGLKDPEDILRAEELDDESKRFYIRSLHGYKNSRSNLSDFMPPSPMMEFYHDTKDTGFDNVIAFDYIPKPKISKPEPAPEYNAPEVLERPNFADYVDRMPVIKPDLIKQDATLQELVGVPHDGLVEDYVLDEDGNIAGSVRVPAGTTQNRRRNYRKLKRGKLDGTMGVFNGERYSQGGSMKVELGDEVDEATMQRLKKQGYTFEEI